MIQRWGPFLSNALQLSGASFLLAEWLLAFFTSPSPIYHVGITPSAEESTHNAEIKRNWNNRRITRGRLIGFGYTFLALGMAIACFLSYPK